MKNQLHADEIIFLILKGKYLSLLVRLNVKNIKSADFINIFIPYSTFLNIINIKRSNLPYIYKRK